MDNTSSSAERAQFEAVWKRVTERTIDPYALPADILSRTSAQPSHNETESPQSAPVPGYADPGGTGPELKKDSSGESGLYNDSLLLKRFITDENHIACRYQALAGRCSGRDKAALFSRLCSESRSFMRKLQANLFILTGELMKLQPIKPPNCSPLQILYDLYRTQSETVKALEDASNHAEQKKVSMLFMSIAAYKRRHVSDLESMIERMIMI